MMAPAPTQAVPPHKKHHGHHHGPHHGPHKKHGHKGGEKPQMGQQPEITKAHVKQLLKMPADKLKE